MGSRHCLKVWTRARLYAAVRAASEGLGIQSAAMDLGVECRLTLHLDASATIGLVNRTGLGKAKHVDMQYPVDTGAHPSLGGSSRRESAQTLKREPRRLDD